MIAKATNPLLRRQLLLVVAIIVVAGGGLELMRSRAEHRAIPIYVVIHGPPTGPMAAQFKAAGITNLGTPTPYKQLTNPPISQVDVAAIKHCLARKRFLPLFPLELGIDGGDVEARYKMKLKRRTNGFYETVIRFERAADGWRISRIEDRRGTACPVRPWKWWEKLLDFVPFVD